tara:strand:- start:54 stop:527 length:474 start_codon:yes stop_codon:yes gene_type:complete
MMDNLYHVKLIRQKNKKDICLEAKFYNQCKQQAENENIVVDNKLISDGFRNARHIKGDLAEHYAINFFIENGNLVFKNVSQHGLADIVVLDNNGNLCLYDVKTISYKKYKSNAAGCMKDIYTGTYGINVKPRTEMQKIFNVKLIYVDLETLNVFIDD